MADIDSFWLFVFSGLALNLTPGADMLFVIDRAMSRGTPAGIAAALGIAVGSALHLLLAVIGVSALLAASPAAMNVLKVIGAAYLFWLGVTLIKSNLVAQTADTETDPGDATSYLLPAFIKGVAVNVLNPKIALFFVAFLPQFVNPNATQPIVALIILGCVFNFVGTAWNFIVAWGAARIRQHLQSDSLALRWYPRVVGILMLALAARLAISEF